MKTSTKLTFEQWMKAVDTYCQQLAYLSVHDLADCCFADWYADGMKPATAAKKAIKSNNE